MFLLKIKRDLCHPKSFGIFEKPAPGPVVRGCAYKGNFFACLEEEKVLFERKVRLEENLFFW